MRDIDFSKLRIFLPDMDISNIDVHKLLDIDVHDLEGTMSKQATNYCGYGLLAREAERQVARMHVEMDNLRAGLKPGIQTYCKENGIRCTKEHIEAECSKTPAWISIQERLLEAEHAAGVMSTLEESFKQRFGMVQQIAKRRSNELANLQ